MFYTFGGFLLNLEDFFVPSGGNDRGYYGNTGGLGLLALRSVV